MLAASDIGEAKVGAGIACATLLRARLIHRLLRIVPQLSRYTLASGIALAIDFATFAALTMMLGVVPTMAGAAGYGLGLVVHFALSSRFVFQASRPARSSTRQFCAFAMTGLVGLSMTTVVIWLSTTLLGMPPLIGKAAAVAASFLAVFVLRRQFVFRARDVAAG